MSRLASFATNDVQGKFHCAATAVSPKSVSLVLGGYFSARGNFQKQPSGLPDLSRVRIKLCHFFPCRFVRFNSTNTSLRSSHPVLFHVNASTVGIFKYAGNMNRLVSTNVTWRCAFAAVGASPIASMIHKGTQMQSPPSVVIRFHPFANCTFPLNSIDLCTSPEYRERLWLAAKREWLRVFHNESVRLHLIDYRVPAV